MDLSAITSIPSVGGGGPQTIRPDSVGGKPAFSEAIGDALQAVNGQQLDAQKSMADLATGATDNLHDVVINVAEADIAFQLVLEIRNRLISSYQELLRMQV